MNIDTIKEWLKRDTSIFIVSLCEIIIGILLFVNPVGFTNGIIIACGVIMLVLGVANIVAYFTTEKTAAAEGRALFNGLLLLAVGGFCAFDSKWFVEVVAIISVLYGIVLMLLALNSVQSMVNMIRLKNRKWFLELINIIVLVAFAVIIFVDPFADGTALWIFIGVALIVSAVYNSVKAIVLTRMTAKVESKESSGEPAVEGEQTAEKEAKRAVPPRRSKQ